MSVEFLKKSMYFIAPILIIINKLLKEFSAIGS